MGNPGYGLIARRTLFGIAISLLIIYVIAISLEGVFDPESLTFVGPIILIPAITGFALRKWTGKTNIAAVIVGLLLVLFNVPFKDVVNPTSSFDYIFQSVSVFGGVIAIITGSMAFKDRNADEPTSPPPMLQYGLAALVVVPAVVAVIGAIGWVSGSSDISDADRAGAAVVEIKNFEFEPESVSSAATKIVVSNNDLFRHNFTVEELGIDVAINPGREAVIDLTGNGAGTYDVTCSIQGHESMESKLVLN